MCVACVCVVCVCWVCVLSVCCVEELFSARVPKSSAEVRMVFIHDIKEVEDVGQQEQQSDKREDEEGDEMMGEVEEIRSNAHHMHG